MISICKRQNGRSLASWRRSAARHVAALVALAAGTSGSGAGAELRMSAGDATSEGSSGGRVAIAAGGGCAPCADATGEAASLLSLGRRHSHRNGSAGACQRGMFDHL